MLKVKKLTERIRHADCLITFDLGANLFIVKLGGTVMANCTWDPGISFKTMHLTDCPKIIREHLDMHALDICVLTLLVSVSCWPLLFWNVDSSLASSVNNQHNNDTHFVMSNCWPFGSLCLFNMWRFKNLAILFSNNCTFSVAMNSANLSLLPLSHIQWLRH